MLRREARDYGTGLPDPKLSRPRPQTRTSHHIRNERGPSLGSQPVSPVRYAWDGIGHSAQTQEARRASLVVKWSVAVNPLGRNVSGGIGTERDFGIGAFVGAGKAFTATFVPIGIGC